MPDHPAFLRAILADPADDTPRLVYADWLDEQVDPVAPAMAEFLRLTAAPPTPDGDRRLQELAAGLEPDWLAVVSRLAVENCRGKRQELLTDRRPLDLRFEFVCDQRWDGMRPTPDRAVRFCDRCREPVHYCESITVARSFARRGRCVSVDLAVPRTPGDISLMSFLRAAGRLSPDDPSDGPDRVSAERDRRRAEQADGERPA